MKWSVATTLKNSSQCQNALKVSILPAMIEQGSTNGSRIMINQPGTPVPLLKSDVSFASSKALP